MTKSQKLALELSRNRQRINELLALDELTDEQRSELDTLTTRSQAAEVEYRAAVVAEDGEIETRETPAESAEERELRQLRDSARVSEFVQAAMEQRGVTGESLEYSQAVGAGGRFPLELLAPELEQRATTDTDSAAMQQTWLDRLFAGTAASHLGVSMRSVSPGVASYPVTTAGAAAAQRGRREAAADTAWTVGVTEIKPTRNAVRAIFTIEDAARLPGLEDALRRDLSAALVEGVDRAIFIGDDGASENTADIVGLQTAADVVEKTITQAHKVDAFQTIRAFSELLDGVHAMTPADLRIVAAVGAAQLWMATQANANRNETVAQIMRGNGLDWMARGEIEAATDANDFGAFIGRGRGIEGAGVAAMWEAGDLVRDPYSGAAKGEVALTLSYLWGFQLPRPANFARLKFVA